MRYVVGLFIMWLLMRGRLSAYYDLATKSGDVPPDNQSPEKPSSVLKPLAKPEDLIDA